MLSKLRSLYHITNFWLLLIVCYEHLITLVLVNIKCTFLYLQEELLGHWLYLCSALVDVARCYCGCTRLYPPAAYESSSSCSWLCFHFNHCGVYTLITLWLGIAFPWWLITLCAFHMFISHLNIFLYKKFRWFFFSFSYFFFIYSGYELFSDTFITKIFSLFMTFLFISLLVSFDKQTWILT